MSDRPLHGEVITSIPTELALRQAEINAYRSLTVAVEHLTTRMDVFNNKLSDIECHLTIIKARDFDAQISKLEKDTKQNFNDITSDNKTRDGSISEITKQVTRLSTFMAVFCAVGTCLMIASVGFIFNLLTQLTHIKP